MSEMIETNEELDTAPSEPTLDAAAPSAPRLGNLTPEQEKARQKAAAMDSVNLLKAGKPAGMSDADWAQVQKANKDHLQIMVKNGVMTAAEAGI